MKRMTRNVVSIASLACLLAAAAACGTSDSGKPGTGGGGGGGGSNGGSGGGSNGGSGAGGVELPPANMDYLFPDVAYTGFDGTHVFKVPVSTNLTNVTWKIDDATIADVAGVATPADYAEYGETWAMVTAKKAGTTKITGTSGAKTVTAMLVVTAYTAANVTAGDKRYNTPDNATAAQRNACAGCHKLANGVDHSPVALSSYKDDEILSAITTGAYPKEADGTPGYVLTGVNHAWNLTDAEKPGIVPYLRTLPSRGF